MKTIFPIRLKRARTMRGLSMDALCGRAGNALSKQAISKYETGKMMPDSKSLIALANALELPVDYFFRPTGVEIGAIEFRKKAKLGIRQIDSIKEIVKDRLERYFEIESINDIVSEGSDDYGHVTVQDEGDVYPIVAKLKSKWELGEDGINSLIEVLEENNIKVIEIDAPKSFDGLSGYVDGHNPVVVLNANMCSERKRFTALHELGHLLMHFDSGLDDKRIERLCNLFASEMLISKEMFLRKIGQRRGDISLQELEAIQMQFGISVDALMYKARHLNIITEHRYLTFQKKKNALGPFKDEVEKSRYKAERSCRFTRLVYRALAGEIISVSKASALLGLPVDEVREQLNLV